MTHLPDGRVLSHKMVPVTGHVIRMAPMTGHVTNESRVLVLSRPKKLSAAVWKGVTISREFGTCKIAKIRFWHDRSRDKNRLDDGPGDENGSDNNGGMAGDLRDAPPGRTRALAQNGSSDRARDKNGSNDRSRDKDSSNDRPRDQNGSNENGSNGR